MRRVVTCRVLAFAVASATVAGAQSATNERPRILERSDIAYVSGADSSQSLDLYLPAPRPSAPFATVLFIHGGSLTSGDRRDLPYATICHNFVRAGVACASVNYRLVRQATWPAQPNDIAAAIAWTLEHIASRGGDPARVVLVGHSSGCHLASLVSADTTYLAAHHHSPRELAGVVAMGCLLHQIPPAIADSAKLRAFFSSGRWIYPSLGAFRDADPTRHVGAHVPPTLVLVAESEQVQPPILESARQFAQRMRDVGRTADVEVLPDRSHISAVEMMADPLDPTFLRIVGFVARGHP
jgi:acetyl esterase/lipase